MIFRLVCIIAAIVAVVLIACDDWRVRRITRRNRLA